MTPFEIVMIILTSIYVIGTLALFAAGVYQIRRYNDELRHQSVLNMADSNREIISMGIRSPELFHLFNPESDVEQERLNRYAQLWINQAYVIWHAYKLGHLSDAEWQPFVRDLRYLFEQPIVKARWESAKGYYSREFVHMVQTNLAASK